MTVFADSSALVKLYADEPGCETMREVPVLVISQIARVEVPAAIWRKVRTGELAAESARLLVSDFEADYFGTANGEPRFAAIAITAGVVDGAARLCAVHRLRAYDAVQLACAVAARGAAPQCDTFAAFDAELKSAAAAEGFALFAG